MDLALYEMKGYIELFSTRKSKCYVQKKMLTRGLISSFSIKTGERFSSIAIDIQSAAEVEQNSVICQWQDD